MMLLPFFVAVLLFTAILRNQWIERERLQFPLARVPLEFTGGSEGRRLLPDIFRNRGFVVGLIASAAFRLLRDLPLFFGKKGGWQLTIPFKTALAGTPLERLYLVNVPIWWSVIGFAYLVPADVSLSIWLFYLVGRIELQTASWMGSSLHYGGTWSQLMTWQLTGAYFAFTVGTLYMARRHLGEVFRKAIGRGAGVDDSAEPVRYSVAFWGLALASMIVVVWFAFYGMKVWVAVVLYLMTMSIMLVHARMVAQSGMYSTQLNVVAPNMLHGMGYGMVFGPEGAIIAQMHHGVFIYGSSTLPAVAGIHAFRISEVFGRRRRLLLPVLVAAIVLGMAASGRTALHQAYDSGAANFSDTWGQQTNPGNIFRRGHQVISNPDQYSRVRWWPFGVGMVATGFVMFMRVRFYWWPVQPIGLLAISSWQMDRLWLPFFLGWLIKTVMVKFTGGRAVRSGRYFFIALILFEAFTGCA